MRLCSVDGAYDRIARGTGGIGEFVGQRELAEIVVGGGPLQAREGQAVIGRFQGVLIESVIITPQIIVIECSTDLIRIDVREIERSYAWSQESIGRQDRRCIVEKIRGSQGAFVRATEVQREVLRGQPAQLETSGRTLLRVLVLLKRNIAEKPVVARVLARKSELQRVVYDWPTDAKSRCALGKVAFAYSGVPGKIVRRIFCIDEDCAGDGVRTVERALWSFDDLHLVDIVRCLIELLGVDFVHTIQARDDRRGRIAVLRDAPNGNEAQPGLLRLRIGHTGNQIHGSADLRILKLAQVRAGNHRIDGR